MKKVIHYKRGTYLPITENWIYGQLKHLRKYMPIVYCHNIENFEVYPVKKIRVLKLEKKNNIWIFFNKCWNKIFGFYPHFAWCIIRDKPGLIHSHFGQSGYSFLQIKEILKIPLITTFYGRDISKLPFLYPEWRKHYTKLFQEGDCFLVEGNHMKKCLIELGCPENKIIVQQLGIDLKKIVFKPRQLNKSKEIKILISAAFREKKGIPYGIEAFARVRNKYPHLNMKLTVIGDSPGTAGKNEEKSKILSVIEKYHLHNYITMLGFQPNHIFRRELYNHHIFLSPNVTAADGDTEGGAPVAIIEASASGMPVLSTTHCDIPEVIRAT